MRGWLGILFCWLGVAAQAATANLVRVAPAQALAGIPFPLTNAVSFGGSISVHAVEELIPAGWTVANISHAGRFDLASRKVKWGPFFDQTARALFCIVTPAAGAAGDFPWQGQASVDGFEVAIQGANSIRVLTLGEANRADGILPEVYAPGVPFEFKIRVIPAANVSGYAIEDTLPAGWSASAFTDGGAQTGGKLRWGPFFDHTTRELRCMVTPPGNASEVAILNGVASFDGFEVPIGGGRQIAPLLSRIAQTLPLFYDPNVAFAAQVAVTPAPDVQVYSIQSTLPAGWNAEGISDGGVFDAATHAVKWGPFFDATPRTLTMNVRPPLGAETPATMATEGAFDTRRILATGPSLVFPRAGSVLRILPAHVGLLAEFSIANQVTPKPGVISWAVQDSVPAGWSIGALSDGGSYDANTHLIKWGPFFDDAPRVLTAALTSGFVAGTFAFTGIASFDGVELAISGVSDLIVDPPPPAVSLILRELPAMVRPGSSFVLSNRVDPADFISVYAVEESVRPGWSVAEISDGGTFDAANRLVKWGPYFDHTPRILTARLTAPSGASGSENFSGHGSFDGIESAITGDASLTFGAAPNRSPTALNDTFTRATDRPLTITVAKLLANDTDLDGDVLTVTVAALSAQGVAVTFAGGLVTYAPSPGFNESDSFTYSVRDPEGATASATVSINPPPAGSSENILGLDFSPTSVVVRFAGIPGLSYDIQIATTLAPPDWTTVVRRTANSLGRFEFTDTGVASSPMRFYRTLFVE